MSLLRLTPGNVLLCKVNSHRHAWAGEICLHAGDWNCGTKPEFRFNKCDRGIPLCFHLNLFNPVQTAFQADYNGIEWILGGKPDQIDGQIILFWFHATHEAGGIRQPERRIMAGAYRVRSSVQSSNGLTWTIYPYPDGWTRFPVIQIDAPPHVHTGGPYVREVQRRQVERVFQSISREIEESEPSWHDPADRDRFKHFAEQLPAWLDDAAVRRNEWLATTRVGQSFSFGAPSSFASSSLAVQVERIRSKIELAEPAATGGARSLSATDAVAPPADRTVSAPPVPLPLVGKEQHEWLCNVHGESIALSLAIGAASKPFLVLRGPTGVGKSHLARHLAPSDRHLLVPVGATWRGREDLLGYANPVTGEFDPTPFTRFLERAARAWLEGDRAPWIVVFDEFNLSQPEHWLADILALSQPDDDAERYIELGGTGFVVDGSEERVTRVLLSKAVRFVATINNDHTVLPLSPRILDRAALIEIPFNARQALERVGVSVGEEQLEVITDLDFELHDRGITFSMRTAQSLRSALEQAEALGVDTWVILDYVLVQEVLSKLRLHATDASDGELLERLKSWQARHGARLLRCAELLDAWDDQIGRGIDVVQA